MAGKRRALVLDGGYDFRNGVGPERRTTQTTRCSGPASLPFVPCALRVVRRPGRAPSGSCALRQSAVTGIDIV